GNGGIRVVVREAAVGVAVDLLDVQAQPPQDRGQRDPAHPVAAVDHHLEPARAELDVLGDVLDVVAQDVVLGGAPGRRGVDEGAGLDPLAQGLDLRAVDGAAAGDDLEPVVLAGVVAGGDHHAAVDLQVEHGEVEGGRVNHADVDHVQPGGQEL